MEQSRWIDDDDDWDDPLWGDEPRKAYREAIQDLQVLLRARPDVHLDWHGGRGTRGDARVVFLDGAGAPKLRVRFRSASQLDALARVLGSGHPLPDHHGLWDESKKTIMARVVGDYDQLVLALARSMLPNVRRGDAVPGSPLGRDVLGLLSSEGAFATTDVVAGSKPAGRALRLMPATEELAALYPSRLRAAPPIALVMEGFEAADAGAAQNLLADYGDSYLHQVVRATGVSLRLWKANYPSARHPARTGIGKIRFPRERYDATPVALYAAANSTGRDPLERYLKYYQVLEFFMPRAAAHAAAQGSPVRSELDQLSVMAELAVTSAQLQGFLRGNVLLLRSLAEEKLIKDVPVLQADVNSHPVPGLDYRPDVAKRVYKIRCRIVHAKEGGGHNQAEVIQPHSREARDMGADLQLIRFVAERVIQHWATSLS
ncbi:MULTISPECIES: hypothetical protein [unclassified Saccharothrix]|uniref:hypothetical protein n=1 Tax=unclassified Saccharothrix TaxID=2593673 RepID=UPI00307DC882